MRTIDKLLESSWKWLYLLVLVVVAFFVLQIVFAVLGDLIIGIAAVALVAAVVLSALKKEPPAPPPSDG